jgi:ATP-dependent Clp protease ATP-binding subunit ClpA
VFERFDERAHQVVVLAQEESRTLKHNYIGTEHILLGLLREEDGLAARVLDSLDVALDQVRANVVRIVGPGEEITSGQIPFTPRAKKILELALREALSLGTNHIGTEHILLGLSAEGEGVAARILLDFGVSPEQLREATIAMLSGSAGRERTEVSGGPETPRRTIDSGWLEGLDTALPELGRAIQRQLGRPPDSGDLLLALLAVPGGRAAQTMAAQGVDPTSLASELERVRASATPTVNELHDELVRVLDAKQDAAAKDEFESAAALRDEAAALRAALADAALSPQAVQSIFRRLGLEPPDPDRP